MSIGLIFDIYKECNIEFPPMILYWNTIKNVNGKAILYQSPSALETEIFKSLKNNMYFILACDCKGELDKLIEKCKEYCKSNKLDTRVDNFLIYSREDGNIGDLIEINEKWTDKYVFFTPKILYGLSYDIREVDVYGIFYNKSINPLNMMQQLSRCRQIKELKIYIRNNTKNMKYNSLKDVKTYNTRVYDTHNKIMNRDRMSYEYSDKCYENLFAYNEYYNDILFSYPKCHLEKILEEKGFKIEYNFDEENIQYNKKAIDNIIKEDKIYDIEKIFESLDNKDIILTTK